MAVRVMDGKTKGTALMIFFKLGLGDGGYLFTLHQRLARHYGLAPLHYRG